MRPLRVFRPGASLETVAMRTYADLITRLRTYVGNDTSAQKSQAVIQAAAEAVQALPSRADWNYYQTSGRITTSAPYSTGTVEFDYTGGTYERQMTLTSGTWPEWAAYGTIVINAVPYDVDKRISATVVTMKSNASPTSDIAAGTSYQIYRARYDLPTDFVAIHKPMITSQNCLIQKVNLDIFLYRRNQNDGTGTPTVFALSDNGYGRQQILFWNPPDTEYAIEFEYKRKPVLPVIQEESTGKISLTASSTALTGISTSFTRAMVGAVLRVGYTNEKPTGFDSVNPPESEYLIDTYTSATAMVLTEAATATVASRGYTISSRLDLMDGPMFEYLVHNGMKRLRIALRINMVQGEDQEYKRAFEQAKAQDAQRYAATDQARVSMAGYPLMRGGYMRTIPGNG